MGKGLYTIVIETRQPLLLSTNEEQTEIRSNDHTFPG